MFDASHGFGCRSDGKLLGGFGECEVFSFHATKFFNTFEGGAVVTNDDALAEKMRLMRNFGFSGYDNVIYPGTNGKMTEIAAAMGLTNLEDLDEFVALNRRNYHCYREAIASIPGLSVLQYDESERNNYQYVVVEVAPYFPVSRDRIVEILHAENILARKYFWPGCHNMQPYKCLLSARRDGPSEHDLRGGAGGGAADGVGHNADIDPLESRSLPLPPRFGQGVTFCRSRARVRTSEKCSNTGPGSAGPVCSNLPSTPSR